MMRYLATIAMLMLPVLANAREVVALTGVLGDLTRQVGGERVNVFVLPQKNLHEREMSPRDAARISRATLVIASGMGLDDALQTQIARIASCPIVNASVGMTPIRGTCDHCTTHASIDPHWWHSIANAKIAVRNICDALVTADPDGAATYRNNAIGYMQRLDELQTWASAALSLIPRNKRRLALPHDALAYFARDFDFEVVSVMGFDAQPSSQHMAKTLRQLKSVAVIFPERGENRKIAETVAKANGLRLGGTLDVDDLSRNTPTYETMMRHNVQTIAEALLQ